MSLYFYIPPCYWIDPVPEIEQLGTPNWKAWGLYDWTIQTYLHLKKGGMDCTLTNTIPESGIIIFHKGAQLEDYRPSIKQLLVCIQADWGRSSYAKVHICQNKKQTELNTLNPVFRLLFPGNTYFVRLWPQAGIIPRSEGRPNVLKRLSFFGLKVNLAAELRSEDWHSFISEHGFEWTIIDEPSSWTNYSGTDAVLFCRDFAGHPHFHKPSSKLYNAWIAGCVPICTPESSYLEEAKGKVNTQIFINSYVELKQKLMELNSQPELYKELRNNSLSQAKHYSNSRILADWITLISKLEYEYKVMQKSKFKFKFFLFCRDVVRLISNIRK